MNILLSDISSPDPRFERLVVPWADGTQSNLDVGRFPGGTVLWCHDSASNSIAHKKIIEMQYQDPNASGEIHPYPGSEPQKFGPGLVVKIPIELAPGVSRKFWPVPCVSPIYGCTALISISAREIIIVCCCEPMGSLACNWLRSLPGTSEKESRPTLRLVG